MDKKTIKIIGFITTLIGFGATALGNYVSGKQQEESINEAVAKQVKEALKNKD